MTRFTKRRSIIRSRFGRWGLRTNLVWSSAFRRPPKGGTPNRTMHKINLAEKLSLIKDHWNPRIAGELNGQLIKLVKFEGPFTWHHHENEDEMFLVVKGRFRMDYREDGSERNEWIEQIGRAHV